MLGIPSLHKIVSYAQKGKQAAHTARIFYLCPLIEDFTLKKKWAAFGKP